MALYGVAESPGNTPQLATGMPFISRIFAEDDAAYLERRYYI